MCRGFLIFVVSLLFVGPVILAATSAGPSSIPTDKPTPEEFEAFDEAMKEFMWERGIHAGTLAVSYRGELVWSQGFGTMTANGNQVVPHDAMMRIASISKPITLATLQRLVDGDVLRLNDYVYCGPGQTRPCWLDLDSPSGSVFDDRIHDITIDYLARHLGGFDRDVSGDPMFHSLDIASDLGVPSPPSQTDIARWLLMQPLDHTPGFVYAYSNVGYMLLGLVIEAATGRDYVDVVQDRVFAPTPVDDIMGYPLVHDIELGRTLPQDRNPREPAYRCTGGWMTTNVYDPSGPSVCWPDGGWDLEALESAGGLIASAPTLTWFMDHYWISGQERIDGQLPVMAQTGQWWFFGSLDGTWAMALQRPDGLNVAVLFNQRYDSAHGWGYEGIRATMDAAADEYRADGGCSGRVNRCIV